jgi:hypothetical protein
MIVRTLLFMVLLPAVGISSGPALRAPADGAPAAAAASALRIRVTPARAFAPTSLFVQAWIERHPDNRAMRISIESAEYFSSSEIQLDGEASARVRVILFRDVPAGEYELVGEVVGDRGRVRVSARASAVVIGP